VLGEPFELRGEKLRYEQVSNHRRKWYQFGEIPNTMLQRVCGSACLVLVCQVDVHKDNLAVSVKGWCRDRRVVLIDYWRFGEDPNADKRGVYLGDTENLDDPHTWVRLRELIETKEYVADDGKRYRIAMTFIDSGYRADDVYRFAAEYESGVYPVKGREGIPKNATVREFSEFTTPMGTRAFGITVDIYKDRWSAALRREWNGEELQPAPFFNAPQDITDRQLRELTVEVKTERIDKDTGQRIGWEWRRPSGAANELWDLLVYANTAIDLFAWDYCRNQLALESVNWTAFWDYLTQEHPFYTE
jgi:phage terminase large subunit GpA-like protein